MFGSTREELGSIQLQQSHKRLREDGPSAEVEPIKIPKDPLKMVLRDEKISDEQVMKTVTKRIEDELIQLPPLLPFKFGNGLLLQYISNTPGVDDKLGIMEVGLFIGLTSLGLYFITVLFNYAKNYVKNRTERGKKSSNLLNWVKMPIGYLNFFVLASQVILLVVMFIYCIFHYSSVNTNDRTSENFVKESIYTFSLVIASIAFFSVVVGAVVILYLKFKQPRFEPQVNLLRQITGETTPLMQLMPMGLANALINLYILKPSQDSIDTRVFLEDLALVQGTITILLETLSSVAKVAILVALRDGHLDADERKTLLAFKVFQYGMLAVQFVLFIVMFIHCLVVYSMEWKVPRNILLVSTIVSGLIAVAGTLTIIFITFVKFVSDVDKKQEAAQDTKDEEESAN